MKTQSVFQPLSGFESKNDLQLDSIDTPCNNMGATMKVTGDQRESWECYISAISKYTSPLGVASHYDRGHYDRKIMMDEMGNSTDGQ